MRSSRASSGAAAFGADLDMIMALLAIIVSVLAFLLKTKDETVAHLAETESRRERAVAERDDWRAECEDLETDLEGEKRGLATERASRERVERELGDERGARARALARANDAERRAKDLQDEVGREGARVSALNERFEDAKRARDAAEELARETFNAQLKDPWGSPLVVEVSAPTRVGDTTFDLDLWVESPRNELCNWESPQHFLNGDAVGRLRLSEDQVWADGRQRERYYARDLGRMGSGTFTCWVMLFRELGSSDDGDRALWVGADVTWRVVSRRSDGGASTLEGSITVARTGCMFKNGVYYSLQPICEFRVGHGGDLELVTPTQPRPHGHAPAEKEGAGGHVSK